MERGSAFTIGALHLLVVALAPTLLWNSWIVDRTNLLVWTAAEATMAAMSFGAFASVRRRRTWLFTRLSCAEYAGTAVTFSALPWLGRDIASSSPSKYVLLIALIAVTSIAATNSSHITRRRPFFAWMIAAVSVSYSAAFMLAGQPLFAVGSVLWCLAIAALTRVGYDAMLELLELRKDSERTARHDDLTGLLSRAAFFDHLERAGLEQDAPASDGEPSHAVLVLFDLDGFKAINDSFGHGAGDAVLETVGKRLRLFLPPDAAIARLGGDEFAAVFSTTHADMVTRIDAVLSAIAEPICNDDRELYVSASAGWTLVGVRESTVDLLAQADAAMYQSKNSETATSSAFDRELRDELDRSLEMRQRFRTALKRHEIVFWAQPLTRLSDHAPVAVELLARWPQQDASVIGPTEFTRIADETGLAVELDRQALGAAASLLRAWAQDPILGKVIVKANMSPVHLHNGRLMNSVHELIPAGLRPRLGLEFVESRLIAAAERNHVQLRDLREMGITVSIDDFGVGYSSLTYLRSLPVSEIKIDRSFVTGVDTDRINRGLVRAIVDLASTLGLPTVAEGIETAGECKAVAELGVSLGQGFFLGRPCPVSDVADQLRRLHHMAHGKPKPPTSIRPVFDDLQAART